MKLERVNPVGLYSDNSMVLSIYNNDKHILSLVNLPADLLADDANCLF